jgi:hypothetical protein
MIAPYPYARVVLAVLLAVTAFEANPSVLEFDRDIVELKRWQSKNDQVMPYFCYEHW